MMRHFVPGFFLCLFSVLPIATAWAQNVGIGTNTPLENLHVAGNLRINPLAGLGTRLAAADAFGTLIVLPTGDSGQVVMQFPSGPAWADMSNDWSLLGNAGTNDTIHFLGTTDKKSLKFRVNNDLVGNLDTIGNVFLGFRAGDANTIGNANVAIGLLAMAASDSGALNIAIGSGALYSNRSGSDNVAIGSSSMLYNTMGGSNTAVGKYTLVYNTIGIGNAAFGWDALFSNTVGSANTAIGISSLFDNTSGDANTAVGQGAMILNTTGSHNVAIGETALSSNVAGDFNTAIGPGSGVMGPAFSNVTAIGANTACTASNQIRLGDPSILSIGGYQDWTNISDARLKKDIQADVPGLAFINRLRPVTYHLDMDAIAAFHHTPDSIRNTAYEAAKGNLRQTGFLAQEVEASAQAIGYNFSGVDHPQNENDPYGLRYAAFTVPLVQAVQELSAENRKLSEANGAMQHRLQMLEAKIETLEQQISR